MNSRYRFEYGADSGWFLSRATDTGFSDMSSSETKSTSIGATVLNIQAVVLEI